MMSFIYSSVHNKAAVPVACTKLSSQFRYVWVASIPQARFLSTLFAECGWWALSLIDYLQWLLQKASNVAPRCLNREILGHRVLTITKCRVKQPSRTRKLHLIWDSQGVSFFKDWKFKYSLGTCDVWPWFLPTQIIQPHWNEMKQWTNSEIIWNSLEM